MGEIALNATTLSSVRSAAGARMSGRTVRRLAAVAATAALGASVVGASPAAAQITVPLEAGENITVFHNIDMVSISGYGPVGSTATVEVRRGAAPGVLIGSVTGATVNTLNGVGLEVNHIGTQRQGDCWDVHTPDIRPGDRVVVRHGADVDEVTVEDIRFDPAGPRLLDAAGAPLPPDAPAAAGNRVVLSGVALRTNGDPIPVELLDGREFRFGQYRHAPDIAATAGVKGGFTLTIPYPYTPNIRNRDLPGEQDRQTALLAAGGLHMVGFGHAAPLPPEAMMIDGLADVPTVGLGCERAPHVPNGITETTPRHVNLAAQAAEDAAPGTDLSISGVSVDATSVTVTVDDADADPADVVTATVTPQAVSTDLNPAARPGSQLWTARVKMSDLLAAGLADGTLTITPTFAKTTGPVTGPAYTLLKDLTAPAAPTADLASGSYFAPRSVTLAAGPLEPVTVHYALGAAGLPAPTATSPVATGPIALSPTGAPQTLGAVSVDRAGNQGTVAAWTYTINAPTAPDSPTGVRVTASGDGGATLVWDAPAANGSPIVDYIVRAYAAGATLPSSVVQATSTSAVVPNLTNGTAYTFEVAARNAVGTGLYSARNASATPLALPSAPTISTARADDGSASVSWTPTANSGGSPVTSYVVRAYLAGSSSWITEVNAGAGDSRTTVTGLTNGTAYDFAVRAVTDVGAGAWSGRSNSVTPTAPRVAPAVTAPGAPLIGRPVRGNASATVSWEPPATTGGSPITGYLVQTYEAGSLTRTVSVGASSFRATVPALRNGRTYTFRVRALNGVGPGQLSAESVSVVPATVASAPGAGKAAAGKARGPVTATAKWTAPKSDGGSAVTAYQVVAERLNAKGRVVRTTTSPRLSAKSRAHAMKLPSGKYRFRIAALNSVGKSSLSARSNTVMAR